MNLAFTLTFSNFYHEKFTLSALLMLLTVTATFLFFSCGKDKPSSETDQVTGAATADERDGGQHGQCNCEYQIIDIQVATDPLHPNYTTEVCSPTACSSGGGCNLFFSDYYSNPICTPLPSLCANFIPGVGLPTPFYPFNCGVTKFGSFFVNSIGQKQDNMCGATAANWTITYQIRCQDSDPSPDCPQGGYGYYSGPITVPGTSDDPLGTRKIILKGCGCKPEVQ